MRSQAARAASSTSSGSGWMPDSPWIGSRITAAVRSSTDSNVLSTLKPGTSGANGACFASCGVADSAPYVRPWKPPSTTTMSPPARWRRASLIAHSFASAPELPKNTLPPSEASDSRSASRIAGSV